MADRKLATCHPARCTALMAAPPEENSAAAASTLRREERGVGSGRAEGMDGEILSRPRSPGSAGVPPAKDRTDRTDPTDPSDPMPAGRRRSQGSRAGPSCPRLPPELACQVRTGKGPG